MKKGDIVRLKEDSSLISSLAQIQGVLLSDIHQAPKELTVSKVEQILVCCTSVTVVSFEEIAGLYSIGHFDVVLEAGEPDVNQLMEESTSQQREVAAMYIGM